MPQRYSFSRGGHGAQGTAQLHARRTFRQRQPRRAGPTAGAAGPEPADQEARARARRAAVLEARARYAPLRRRRAAARARRGDRATRATDPRGTPRGPLAGAWPPRPWRATGGRATDRALFRRTLPQDLARDDPAHARGCRVVAPGMAPREAHRSRAAAQPAASGSTGNPAAPARAHVRDRPDEASPHGQVAA